MWWCGRPHPADPDGFRAVELDWLAEHFVELPAARPVLAGLGRPLAAGADFLTVADRARDRTPV